VNWRINPLNPPTRNGLNWITKFLTYHKVSRIGLTIFNSTCNKSTHMS